MAYLAVLFYHLGINIKGVMDLDYLELLSFCAFDVLKAHEIAQEHGVKPFSESIKEREYSDHKERVTEDGCAE